GATEFGKRPDWIFVDFAHYWLPPIAEQHKVPCALLYICPPFVAFIGPTAANEAHPRTTAEDLMAQPRWIPFPTTIAHRLHEAKDMLVQTVGVNHCCLGVCASCLFPVHPCS
uniref:Uncharacterized protein n=1 Tax=Aegilops tauschii subsp. strangulata TaxID=200361 RepID=A0A453TCV9_AEGTS